MQYLLLIYDDEKRWAKGYDDDELEQYGAFGKEFEQSLRGGKALQATRTAMTVRVRDGKRLTTDGPFAETKEHLRGSTSSRPRTPTRRSASPRKIPAAKFGSIEVRPLMKFD